MVEVACRFLAGHVAREKLHGDVHVLVVAERKKGHAKRFRIAAGGHPVNLYSRNREAWILDVAHTHARDDVRRGGAVDDHFGPAEIDVVPARDNGHARLLEADRDAPGHLARDPANAPDLAGGRHKHTRRAGLALQPWHRFAHCRLHRRRARGRRRERGAGTVFSKAIFTSAGDFELIWNSIKIAAPAKSPGLVKLTDGGDWNPATTYAAAATRTSTIGISTSLRMRSIVQNKAEPAPRLTSRVESSPRQPERQADHRQADHRRDEVRPKRTRTHDEAILAR